MRIEPPNATAVVAPAASITSVTAATVLACVRCAERQKLIGSARSAPAIVPIDITPQKHGEVGSMARSSKDIKMTITGIIPAITAFIEIHVTSQLLRSAAR